MTVAAAVAAVLAGAARFARAQEARSSEPIEEVAVTGIRHSIETSIAVKRELTSIVEVVSAEDIGKLPDTSIADSIARLPGLAAQRIEGRPAAISIRGLGEDYAGSLLNGRQVVSSSEGRSAEYDQFPSELVNQVVVYKTVDAGVVGQGLSGTIDIRPLMPLSLNRRQIALSARAEKNSNGSLSSTGKGEYGNRFSASFVDQFANDTIGLALGFAHLDSPGQAKKFGSWGIGDYNGQWGSSATGVPFADGSSGDCFSGSDCAVFPQGFESSVTSSKQVRDGAMAIVQFKPNDSFSSAVDLYYSKFKQDRTGHHWTGDIGLWSGGANFTNVQTGDVNGNTAIRCHDRRCSQPGVRQELGPYRQDPLDRLAKRVEFHRPVERDDGPRLFARRPRRALHPVRRAGERRQLVQFHHQRQPVELVYPAGPDRPGRRAADE